MSEEYDMKDLIPGSKKRKDRSDILSRIQDMEEDSYATSTGYTAESFLPSSMLKKSKKEKKKEEEESNGFNYDPDAWFNELLGFQQNTKISKKRIRNELFDSAGITGKKKKKKGKKNKDGDMIDFNKEFEPEAALYKNLLMEQTRFTDSLQKEYDQIKSTKSSSRGVTKQITDLVENITDARALAMQLIDKQVSVKKQAAELNMKQRKEMGAQGDSENMADFASSYLKQMLTDRQQLFNGGSGDSSVSDYTEEELFNDLSESLNSDEDMQRPEEVDKYLKYENSNVTVYVVITDDDVENYEFLAKDQDGNIIDDYPMPNHTQISVNRSTGIATDTYGKKYTIIWN